MVMITSPPAAKDISFEPVEQIMRCAALGHHQHPRQAPGTARILEQSQPFDQELARLLAMLLVTQGPQVF